MDADTVTAMLIAAGIVPLSKVCECKDARKRSGSAPSWYVLVAEDAKIPPGLFAPGWYRNGREFIFQLKEG